MGPGTTLWMLMLAAVSLLAAGYAQARIPRHTAGRSKVSFTRGFLAAVGIAFGLTAAAVYDDRTAAVLAFLIGFGLVHLPAALILFFKGARREGRT
jgi:hypothetical protein